MFFSVSGLKLLRAPLPTTNMLNLSQDTQRHTQFIFHFHSFHFLNLLLALSTDYKSFRIRGTSKNIEILLEAS
jgi:hypothetical protein